MANYFKNKSDDKIGGGFVLFVIGGAGYIGAITAKNDNLDDLTRNMLLSIVAGAGVGAGCSLLISGAKNKGYAEMLYTNPDPLKAAQLAKEYARNAKKNSIIGLSLFGIGIIVPLTLMFTADDIEGMSPTAQTVTKISVISFCVSIPFLMEAEKNKGRLSILTRTEHISTSFMQNTGAHRSIGIGFPIGK